MSDAGPFVAWLAFSWVLFVVGNSISGLVDAWRTRALVRADKTRAQTAALAHGDDSCDVDDCEVFRCEACDRHTHSVGMPDGWAFDTEESVYLCGDCHDADHGETPPACSLREPRVMDLVQVRDELSDRLASQRAK